MHRSTSFIVRNAFCRATLVAAAVWLCSPAPTRAQASDYVVVPVTRTDEHLPALVRLSESVDAELETRGLSHLRFASTRGVFENRHSRDPIPASQEDIDLLVTAANNALSAVTNADWKTALDQLGLAMAKGAKALESTNRNYKTAQHLFHACLLAVQGLVENGNEVEARRQAIECRVRSPGMELPPDSRDYPPYVREYLIEAREALAQARTAPLLVSSEPSDCSVFVNGRRLGTTPYRQENPARRPQLIQVECGEGNPGRVHTITPGDETPPLVVNTVFESSIATDGGILRLRYNELDDPHTRSHVRILLQALDARQAIVLSRPHPDRLALTRHSAKGAVATAFVRESFTSAELSDALTVLLREELSPTDSEGPALAVSNQTDLPVPGPRETVGAESRAESSLRWTRTAAGVGAAAATGALVASWWLFAQRKDDGAVYRSTLPSDDAYVANGQTWVDGRKMPYFLGAAGSTALAASAATLAFSFGDERYAWWVYASTAALGVGLAGWGAVDLAQGGACDADTTTDRRFCVLDQEQRDRGALLMLNAVPLLFVPTVHALFSSPRKGPVISLVPTVERSSAALTLRFAM